MNLQHCNTHKIDSNLETVDMCPLCELKMRQLATKVPPIVKKPSLGIGARNKKEYQKKYKELNHGKLKAYKTEWTRKKRDEWRKKYGRIFY